jgi:DNA-binding NarL/FixJ family response regulator
LNCLALQAVFYECGGVCGAGRSPSSATTGGNVPLILAPSDRAALQLLADGRPIKQIADNLGIPQNEIEARVRTLFSTMGASTRTEAVAVAERRGLITR